MSYHVHRCHTCGTELYACREAIQEDDCGRFCANCPTGTREWCEACLEAREALEADVNEAMHDEEGETCHS